MFLPYASDQKRTRLPVATLSLLVINCIIYIGFVGAHAANGRSYQSLMAPWSILPSTLRLYTLITYMFAHASIVHLVVNMFFLAVFGAGVEDAVGAWRLTGAYLLCGVAGGILEFLVVTRFVPEALWSIPIAGASAACAGLVGVYAVRYYRARISFALTPLRPHVVVVVAGFFLYQVIAALLTLIHNDQSAAAAYWAHLGGFTVGMGFATLLGLRTAGEVNYTQADAYRALESGRPGESLARWNTVLARDPNNTTAMLETARCWFALGEVDHTQEMFTRLLQLHTSRGDRPAAAAIAFELETLKLTHKALPAAVVLDIAAALEQKSNYALSQHYYNEASLLADCTAPDAALLRAATLLAKRLHDTARATLLLTRLIEEYPGSPWRSPATDLLDALNDLPRP